MVDVAVVGFGDLALSSLTPLTVDGFSPEESTRTGPTILWCAETFGWRYCTPFIQCSANRDISGKGSLLVR